MQRRVLHKVYSKRFDIIGIMVIRVLILYICAPRALCVFHGCCVQLRRDEMKDNMCQLQFIGSDMPNWYDT